MSKAVYSLYACVLYTKEHWGKILLKPLDENGIQFGEPLIVTSEEGEAYIEEHGLEKVSAYQALCIQRNARKEGRLPWLG